MAMQRTAQTVTQIASAIWPPACPAPDRRRYAAHAYSYAVKVREVIKMIESDGWYLVRTMGSHRQFHHPNKSGTDTIAGNPSVDLPPGTLNTILKQAGLKDQ